MPVAIFKDDYKKAAKAMDYHPLIDGIALAIAEERERCAKIGAGYNGRSPKDARDIAERIRGAVTQSSGIREGK